MKDIDYQSYTTKPSSSLDHLPGETGWPILNQTVEFLLDSKAQSKRLSEKYGLLFRGRVLFQDTVVALGPEANKAVMMDSDGIYSNKLAWDPILDKLFPNGLMLRDFEEHKHHRRIMQSAFKKHALEGYVSRMVPHFQRGVQDFAGRKKFGFKTAIKELLLDVAAEVFLGVDMGDRAHKINQAFIDTMMGSTAVVKVPLLFNSWGKALKGRATLESFIAEHIQAKRKKPGPDFFSQICQAKDEEGNYFSDDAVRDHIIFLLFAAHDTTTSTLCSVLYFLSKNQEWQSKLHKEFSALPEELSFDDLATMENSVLVFKESLRLRPPLTSITRRCLQETELLGHKIPRNAQISISPLFTHYMAECWDRPEAFEPDRFGPERAEHKRHSYQWVPFGGGAHKCIGLNFAELQVKLFLFHLLRNYRVTVADDYDMKVNWVPLTFPRDEMQVRLEPR